jgi:FkbH-like protein
MYESEANSAVEDARGLPQDVIRAFGHLNGRILLRTVLPWSEHCTECGWPACYSTCDLYSPREDGKCRRFVDGMVRVECKSAVNGYLVKVRFKRWGKLWTPGNIRLHPPDKAQQLERRDFQIGKTLFQLELPTALKKRVISKRYGFKSRMAARKTEQGELPTAFVLECYNPEADAVRLTFTMRPKGERSKLPFQELSEAVPGFNRIRLSLDRIAAQIDVRQPFEVEIIPNGDYNETTLYFGLMDFIKEANPPVEKKRSVKCVVWDLDNTVWDGILIEDGEEKLRLKPTVKEVIRELDSRGILQSVASKNNAEDALRVLKKFGIDEYFLCPQILWRPKSESIRAIVQQLNIGADTFLFVDDSEFERQQVRSIFPQIRVLDAEFYATIPEMQECQVPVTNESRKRRKLYQVEFCRKETQKSFGNDYLAFLCSCDIELTVQPMKEENLERAHELTQRTNQMNFSGNRYDRDVLRSILSMPHLHTFVLSCKDRFGTYGVIGFSIVDTREPRMTDLMFSCRIQSKRVEHAFMSHLIRKYGHDAGREFYANYRKTPQNAPSGTVFADLGMREVETNDGVTSLVFPPNEELPDERIVRIVHAN